MSDTKRFDVGQFAALAARAKEVAAATGDALHFAKLAAQAEANYRLYLDAAPGWQRNPAAHDAWTAQGKGLRAECDRLTNEVVQRLRRAKKMKATTPAGIYAKALLVRCSRTGARELAMSLAVDLVDCEALRATLWAGGAAARPGEAHACAAS